jgi:hypothetical protein
MENAVKSIKINDPKKRISKEEKKLRQVMRDVTDDRVQTVDGLIKRAAFMRITLEGWEKDIQENGYVEPFSQSDKAEHYDRERPVVRLYNQMIKNYSQVMRQLLDLIPNKPAAVLDPAYDKFFTQ